MKRKKTEFCETTLVAGRDAYFPVEKFHSVSPQSWETVARN